jgi:hypothetical protein
VLEGEAELSPVAVEKSQVKVAPRVVGLELESAAKLLFRFSENPGLELNQPEVRVEDRRVGVAVQQGPRGARRLVVIAPLELRDGEEIEDVLVARPREQRELELLARDVVLSFLEKPARACEVNEVDPLFRGGG